MSQWDDISFVIRSRNRRAVLEALSKPKTPTQLSKELKLNVGYISNILIELLKRGLIKCLSPNEKRHRFYLVTSYGKKIIAQLKEVEKG